MNLKTTSRLKKYVLLSAVLISAVMFLFVAMSPNSFSQNTIFTPATATSIHFYMPYLPAKTSWEVKITNATNSITLKSSTKQINATVPIGTYSYTVAVPASYLVPNPKGTIDYTGQQVNVTVGLGIINCSTNCVPGDIGLTSFFLPKGKKLSATLVATSGNQVRSTNIIFNGNESTINFTKADGTYTLKIAQNAIPGYASSWVSNVVSLSGNNIYATANVTFAKCPKYPANCTSPEELIIFRESSLANNTKWGVTLAKGTSHTTEFSTTPLINFTEGVGTYTYTINSVSGYTSVYPNGTITVNTYKLWNCVSVPFLKTSGAASFASMTSSNSSICGASQNVSKNTTYGPGLQFNEPLLPAGLNWSVTVYNSVASIVTHSNSKQINVLIPNGTYNYTANAPKGYMIPNPKGTIDYTGEQVNVTVGLGIINCSINCVPGDIGLTSFFLPKNKKWSATLSGIGIPTQTRSSNTFFNSIASTINFTEGYGVYNVTIPQNSAAGYASSWVNNTVNFSTSSGLYQNVSGGVTFTKCPKYPANCTSPRELIIFQEFGLANNTKWSMIMNNLTVSSTTPFINFTETPGTYKFVVGTAAGYLPQIGSGTITVGTGALWTCIGIPFNKVGGGISANAMNVTQPAFVNMGKMSITSYDPTGETTSYCWPVV